MSFFEECEPAVFFKYFEAITRIPRGSFHEEEVSNYLKKFAEDRKLEVVQDGLYNIFIKKPGTPGYENSEPVVFHGHMDMILAKDKGVNHDMLKEGIRLKKEGEWVSGTGTTLGADNGVGIAFILAILDSEDIPHPPLEVVITVREEVGKAGLSGFDLNQITGHRLIDFNWRNWDSVYAACAGDVSVNYDYRLDTEPVSDDWQPVNLKLDGFVGGHSEHEIVLQRANAIVVFARLINEMLINKRDVRLVHIEAGVNRYAIPNTVETILMVRRQDTGAVKQIASDFEEKIKYEFRFTDPDIRIFLEKCECERNAMFTKGLTEHFIKSICILPNGVQSVCLDRPELPESSCCIALLETSDTVARIVATIPSAITSAKYFILQKFKDLAYLTGATVDVFADCPEWPYNPDSKLLKTAVNAFRKIHGREPGIMVAHSSLEVGMFRNKFPNMDMLSVGAESQGYHTTRERFHYTTAKPAYEFIKELLKELQ